LITTKYNNITLISFALRILVSKIILLNLCDFVGQSTKKVLKNYAGKLREWGNFFNKKTCFPHKWNGREFGDYKENSD